MLGFFRRFQKLFIVVVTFFVVVSSLFFRTGRTAIDNRDEPDQKIGVLVDGSPLMQRRLDGLIALLEHGIEGGSQMPNLLADSLVHRRFILSELGTTFAEHFFDDLEEELCERWERMQNYVPYAHPYAPHISAEQVWRQFSPTIIGALSKVRSGQKGFSKEQVAPLFECYRAQAAFPPHLLHQMLCYRQQQGQGIRPDPGLEGASVALFGFESVKDWFGPTFVRRLAEFILNASCIAKDMGYQVRAEEAQVDLYKNVARAVEHLSGGQAPNAQQVERIYAAQIQSLGVKEAEAISIWQDVLAFEQMFEEAGQGVFFDSLSLDHFKEFASKAATVIHYQMPKALRFSSFRDMLKFQHYKEIVSEGDLLAMPQNFRDPQEVMQEHPTLVYKCFDVEVVSVTRDEVAARIPLKKTWEWEWNADHFAMLKGAFPSLEGKQAVTLEERMECLDQLDAKTRFEVDQFARFELVKAHPDWIEEELASQEAKSRSLNVKLAEEGNPLSGAHFLALIESESPELNCYTTDGIHFSSVKVLKKHPGWHFVPFEEAGRALEEDLDRVLRLAHARRGYAQPFEKVEDRVVKEVFTDLIAALGGNALDLDALALCRFDEYLKGLRELALTDPDAFAVALEAPYAPNSSTEKWELSDSLPKEGEYSCVENGAFFQLISQDSALATEEEIASLKDYLSKEAQARLMRILIEKI